MKIEGRRLPRSGDGLVRPAVVSFPKARFFDLTDSAAVYMVGTDRIWTDGGSNCFRADFCDELQAGGQVLVFERDGETTAALTAKRYRFPIPAAAAGGETLRLVSVQFEDGGKCYDYRCGDETAEPGDLVLVDAAGETKQAVVAEVREVPEDELILPPSGYKRILSVVRRGGKKTDG